MGNPHRPRRARTKRRHMTNHYQQELPDEYFQDEFKERPIPVVTQELTPEDLERLLPIKSKQYLAHARKEIFSAWSEQCSLHHLYELQLCSIQPAPDIKKLLLIFTSIEPLNRQQQKALEEDLQKVLVSIRLELGRSSSRKRVPHLSSLILPPLQSTEVEDG